MFWKKQRKKITDEVKADRAKYNTMEEQILNNRNSDVAAINHVKATQMELINIVQEHEKCLADIREMLGVEENTADKIAYSEYGEEVIVESLDNTLTMCNLLDNLPEVKEKQDAREALAKILCTFTQDQMDGRFHESLSCLEKCGMLSDDKYRQHVKKVNVAKTAVAGVTYALFDIAPLAIDYYKNKLKKNEWERFIIGSYAYINGELNPIMRRHIYAQLQEAGLAKNSKEAVKIVDKKFNEYINHSINLIPLLDNKLKSQIDIMEATSIAKSLVSHCDLADRAIKERAGDVISGFLRFNQNDTERILEEAQNSQEYLTNLVSFSSKSFVVFFNDYIKDVHNAQEFARYDINADIYKKHRDKTKDTFDQMVRDVMAQDGIFLTARKRVDIIMANAKMMERTLNPSIDFAATYRLKKRNVKVAEFMDIQYLEMK